MKKFSLILILTTLSMGLFSQPEHIRKFLKCGFPRLQDYRCFNYDSIKTGENIFELQKAENYNQKQIPRRYLTRMHIMRTSAFLVIKNNKIIHEEYWLNFNKDSLMNSFSVAKSIVAILLGIAIDEGYINNLEQKVSFFLPWFNVGRDSSLRLIDLLSMSSGLNWTEEFANPMSDIAMAYYSNKLDSLIKNTHVKTKPGKKWNYQCANTILLSLIIEKVTGMPISKFAEEKLWKPLGASHTALWGKSGENGPTKAFCCFYATARDFAKLGLLVLNKGKFNGKQIVSKNYINKIIQPASWLKYKKKNVDFYALHFWLVKYKGEEIPYFCGLFGQYIFILPKENAVVVRFGEMVNELKIEPVPPDVKLYLNAAEKLLK